ncbi:MAG: transposase [Capsulimonadales bacterium]|nr:transposase [Capsulimonadales bacterium]
MKLVAQVKLMITPEQSDALLRTMRIANAACDYISDHAWKTKTFQQFSLHKATYHAVRETFPLTAQMVVRCNAKVADAYKLDKTTKRTFKPLGSIAYDDRILSWKVENSTVSIRTVDGRISVPFVCGDYQKEMLRTRQGETDLAYIDGQFYLLAVCNVEEPPLKETKGFLGIDLGIVHIATDSEGRQYSGEAIRNLRQRVRKHRSGLQHQAKKRHSSSAYRRLKAKARKVSRFGKWLNHNISKQIVQNAVSSLKALVLENLSGIPERANGFNKEMRWQLGNWSFYQLAQMVVYKAKKAGIPVVFVDPRNTSRTCNRCGYCDKANRKSQSQFVCLQCGCCMNADLNAALNIATRGNVTCPMVATPYVVA